jgi:group II intron reverse transcriptase/maturase
MNGHGQSDGLVVPTKSSNKAESAAEEMEGRKPTKGSLHQQNTHRTQGRERVQSALTRIRTVATKRRKDRFTSLYHHICNTDMLREAYLSLKRDASPGVDKETWQSYGEDLEANLDDLNKRLKRGAYQAKPVRRTYIPKADGRMRPLGVTTLEDKVVQKATVAVLNAVYETDFMGFSYGFRPGRSQHNALDALAVAMKMKNVNWVLDADIRGYFDAISHEWLLKFVEHRIGDHRVTRLIQKWLKAGVMENGEWNQSSEGAPQGGSASPLLANLYLHYVLDLWVQQWRMKRAHGDVVVVRYADDFVVGFERYGEAIQFLEDLKLRMSKFGLELHPEKTRLIEFGRNAVRSRKKRGLGKPETFNFLGLTHICGMSRNGHHLLLRHTMRQRMQAKLREVRTELKKRRHHSIPDVGKWLGAIVRGHTQYYGVPTNSKAIAAFRHQIIESWRRTLMRRSQRTKINWERMASYAKQWIPPARIVHAYPEDRMRVTTQGRSRMR